MNCIFFKGTAKTNLATFLFKLMSFLNKTRQSRPIRCDVWIVERLRYPTGRPTNQPTDTASYRGALSHLKRRHEKVTVTTCSEMFMDALCVEFFVTNGTSIVSVPFPHRSFRLAYVVEATCGACEGVENVHCVTCKMPSKFKWFI